MDDKTWHLNFHSSTISKPVQILIMILGIISRSFSRFIKVYSFADEVKPPSAIQALPVT
jgi:hypothetical protein